MMKNSLSLLFCLLLANLSLAQEPEKQDPQIRHQYDRGASL